MKFNFMSIAAIFAVASISAGENVNPAVVGQGNANLVVIVQPQVAPAIAVPAAPGRVRQLPLPADAPAGNVADLRDAFNAAQ